MFYTCVLKSVITQDAKKIAMNKEQMLLLLETPIDQTKEELGRAVYSPPRGALPPSAAEFMRAAEKWLQNNQKTICEMVCHSDDIRSFIAGGRQFDRAQAAGIVWDIFALNYSGPTLGWMTVTIIKIGLAEFCTCE